MTLAAGPLVAAAALIGFADVGLDLLDIELLGSVQGGGSVIWIEACANHRRAPVACLCFPNDGG
jgi:hypothetical protein